MDAAAIELLSQNVELLQRIYVVQLFVVGVCAAACVCIILYKFLREFF